MLRKPSFAVIISTLYLLVYIFFVNAANFSAVFYMFLGAPVVLVWLAYTIFRYGKFTGQELKEGEEWGYGDKPRSELTFNDN